MRLAEVEPYLQRQVEHREYERSVLGWFGVKLPWLQPAEQPAAPWLPQDQVIGQACNRRLIPICEEFFGEQLAVACRSCPGPRAQTMVPIDKR